MTTLMLKTKLINSRHLRKLLLKGLFEGKLDFNAMGHEGEDNDNDCDRDSYDDWTNVYDL